MTGPVIALEKAVATLVVGLVVALVPRSRRDRYRAEFAADLASLPPAARIRYAVGLLASAPRLRSTVVAGSGPTLVCRLRIHTYRTIHPNPEDMRVLARECTRCGHIDDIDQWEPKKRADHSAAYAGASTGHTT